MGAERNQSQAAASIQKARPVRLGMPRHRRPVHAPDVAGGVEGRALAVDGEVVPDEEVAVAPFVRVDEFVAAAVLAEIP